MKKLTIAALVTVIVGSATYTAIAQQQRGLGDSMVEAVDANQDGNISKEEMTAHRAEKFASADTNGDTLVTADEHAAADKRMDRLFDRVDTDGDGVITEAEREAAKEKMQNRRGKRGMGRRG